MEVSRRREIIEKSRRLIEVPTAFVSAARDYPRRVDEALSLIDKPAEAALLLAKADGLAHFAARVRADTETVNCIQRGKFKIIDKLGELLPRAQGKGGGPKKQRTADEDDAPDNGAETSPTVPEKFNKNTLTEYRKVHDNADKIDSYFDSLTADDGLSEASLRGFARYVHDVVRGASPAPSSSPSATLLKDGDTTARFRLIVMDACWVTEFGSDWLEYMASDNNPGRYAEPDCLLFMRTGGDAEVGYRCGVLMGHWQFKLSRRSLAVTGILQHNGEPWENVIVGYRGAVPLYDFLPRAPVPCLKGGIEETAGACAKIWCGTKQSLRLHVGGGEVAGFTNWTLEGEDVA